MGLIQPKPHLRPAFLRAKRCLIPHGLRRRRDLLLARTPPAGRLFPLARHDDVFLRDRRRVIFCFLAPLLYIAKRGGCDD